VAGDPAWGGACVAATGADVAGEFGAGVGSITFIEV
jgi:hypothetical protein